AEAVGAKPPMRIPVWLARLGAGEAAGRMLTASRGGANEKAERGLGGQPPGGRWGGGVPDGVARPAPAPAGRGGAGSRRGRRAGDPGAAAADAFVALRPLLFSIAYRMLGSVSEAEDIVQDAFLRHQRAVADGVEIDSPKAYLSAVVTRLSIDELRSARVRRET